MNTRHKNILKDTRGVAMVMALMFSAVLFIVSGIFMLRVTHENRMVDKELGLQKTFYAAQAASQLALAEIDTFINTDLLNTVSNANPNSVINYTKQKVNQGKSIEWLVYAVRKNNVPVLTQNEDQAEYSAGGTINGYAYRYDIVITQNGDPYSSGVDAWEFPLFYKIISSAGSGGLLQMVYLNGDFTVRVQRDNFAKYALFTNQQNTETGETVWFTDKTNFAGPVHTNDRFNFALNPSATFEGLVTQDSQWARFYNDGSPLLINADANGTTDVPLFHSSFTRDAGDIQLSSPVQQQDMADQAKGGKNINKNGIYIPANGNTLSGGIYVRGNGVVTLSVQNSKPVYTITQGSSTKTITLDRVQNQTTVLNLDTGVDQTYQGLPDGQDDVGTLIFVQGSITSLSGTTQSDEQATIASSNDIVISNNLRYETYTPASGTPGTQGYVPPSAVGATNLLGLVSWGGDVRIGTSAPDNVDVHATILAKQGVYEVDNYDNIGMGPRGTSTLLGGVVSDRYGAFGQFNGATGQQISGYGRNFVYDDRMLMGASPPYFPTLNTFIAFTNDLTDKIIWQEGE